MPSRTVLVPNPAPTRAGDGHQEMKLNQENTYKVLQETTLDLNYFESNLLDIEIESTTANNLFRDFNTSATNTTELNTPEITNGGSLSNFDECFSTLFHESLNKTDDIVQFIIDQDNSRITNENTLHNAISSSFPEIEDICTFSPFETENFEPCLSAAEVEGVSAAPQYVNEPNDFEDMLDFNPDIENKDLLQWIMDDQNIEVSFETELPEPKHPEFFIEVKDETSELNDQEKYRKMRDQNNEASRRCRQNKKRKLAEVEKEAEILEKRNKELRVQLEEMEAEVALLKRNLLTDISRKNKRYFEF